MRVGVPKETAPRETRVSLIPAGANTLKKAGLDVVIETGAGAAAGFPDAAFREQGASIVSRSEVFQTADILLQVRAAPASGPLRSGQAVIGFADPLGAPQAVRDIAATGATLLSMELMPRITRAQSMDALSSMATIAGYKGVLLAADALPRMFPMLMTAAGTISAARVFIMGAGVAGLQAISAARRLGAKVEAYDVRPAVKEQVQSLGAKFVELPLEAADAEDKGGYAKAQDESFYRRQREMMLKVVATQRRRHHHRIDPRKARADPRHARNGRSHGSRIGRRRPGGRARRQLRAHQAGRGRIPPGRHDSRPLKSTGARPLPREPDVLEEHHHFPVASARQGRGPAAVALVVDLG